ncbi:hypothetical protein QBC42DRAFT_256751 [Cladorrhinum samala]|uniref:Uncharacterized protein n=1 Tax=Cladorrhinum samala TaxID=585594 RepID=A0AAV9HBX3_9PEZI|nr:hypothetical protein QBC42DRAFT_256751 [Cladorrhinum samala]
MHSSKDSNSFATVSMGTSCKRASCDVGCAAAISGQGERWELGIEAGLNNVTRTTLSRSPAYLGAEFYSRRASGKFSRVDDWSMKRVFPGAASRAVQQPLTIPVCIRTHTNTPAGKCGQHPTMRRPSKDLLRRTIPGGGM